MAQRNQGACPESHSQGAADRQPGWLISDGRELRRPVALHPGAPRTIVSDQMLFPKHRSQLRRSGRPFSRLAACAAMPPTQGEESWRRLKRSNELIHTEMWVREEGKRETLAVLTLSRNSLPAGETGRGESEGSATWPQETQTGNRV